MSEAGKRSGRGASKREAQAEREEGRGDEAHHDEAWREKLERDPEFASRVLRTLDGLVPGALKRAAATGVGNILQGEDGLLASIADNKKLPKEAVGLLVSQADSLRRETLRIISKEIRVFLENVDLGGELAKILTSVSFEIKPEIRFVPNDQAVRSKNKGADEEGGEGGAEGDATPEPKRTSSGVPIKLRWGKRRKDALAESSEPRVHADEPEDAPVSDHDEGGSDDDE